MKRLFSPKKLRILFLALAVVVQAAVIVIPYVFLKHYIVHFNGVFRLVSVFVVLYILKSDINPVYKIPWIVLLLALPVFGGVLYIIYGRLHFSKKDIMTFVDINNKCKEALALRPSANDSLEKEAPLIYPQAKYLLDYALAPTYNNTETTYFPLGDDMFPVMLSELNKAEKFIFMEYFIIEDGLMLNSILDILKEKAPRGVDVRFMYDSLGSIAKAPVDIVRDLRKAGIRCFEFNTFRSILDNRYNNRDHRKICVIDGNVGFTGGVNLADEYINVKTVYGHWKDTAIMIKGDAVWSLTNMFLTLWDGINKCDEDFRKYLPDIDVKTDNGYVIPYTDFPIDNETVGKSVYLNMINRANRYIYIMTPYLILDNTMATSLCDAAKSGIDVRLITPGIADKKLVNLLTKSYYDKLIEAGVKIYEYTPGFVHAKIFVSDDETAVVGTINLDYRSLAHHFENAIWMYKTDIVADIKKDFLDTQEKCERITLEKCMKKSFAKIIFLPILRLFSPML